MSESWQPTQPEDCADCGTAASAAAAVELQRFDSGFEIHEEQQVYSAVSNLRRPQERPKAKIKALELPKDLLDWSPPSFHAL